MKNLFKMRKLFKKLVVTSVSATLLATVLIPTNTTTNNLDIIKLAKAENTYVTPITLYPISTGRDITVYKDRNGTVDSSSKIYGSDKCKIIEFYSDGYCKVEYPVKNGIKTRYAKTSSFIYNPNASVTTVQVSSNTTVYIRSDLSQKLGTTYTTDTIYLVSTNGSSSQIIYNISGGWKCGWIPSSAITNSSSYEQTSTLADGIYYIIPKCAQNKVLDINGAGKNNFDNLHIYDKGTADNQKFNVTSLGNGYYKITACHSGKVLDVNGGVAQSGTNVSQYEWNGTDAQEWIIKYEGDGWYSIISKLDTNLYLDIYGAGSDNRVNIQVYENNGSDAQRFRFESTNVQSSEKDYYENNVGNILGNLGSYKTELDGTTGIKGQCVWYVRNRANEKLSKLTGISGNANVWYNKAKNKGLSVGTTPKSNSIVCWNGGKYGHLAFIEYVDGDTIYLTEANFQGSAEKNGVLQKMSFKKLKSRKDGFQGFIYL